MTTPPQLCKSRTSRLRRALGGEQLHLYVLAIAIGASVSVGRESPAVHIGASIDAWDADNAWHG